MKILIGGDVAPINSNKKYFIESNDFLVNVLDSREEYDLRIINLEAPLTYSNDKIDKPGPNLKSSPSTVKGLLASKINLVSLANNHIGDYGLSGVMDTIKLLRENNINIVGAGEDLIKSNEPFIYEKDMKIAVFSFSDTEFGMASLKSGGANPLEICDLTLNIINTLANVDRSIVLLHECKEYHKYPSPKLQKICRYICDLGVDIIVCQHSHVAGAWEIYKGKNIFYGQGNLIFDYGNRNSDEWLNGYLLEIDFQSENTFVKQIPYVQKFPGIKKLDYKSNIAFFSDSLKMKNNVKNQVFIENYWIEKIKTTETLYFSLLRGHSRLVRGINKFTGFTKLLYNKKDLIFLLNIFRSRVHREAVIKILEQKINENDK